MSTQWVLLSPLACSVQCSQGEAWPQWSTRNHELKHQASWLHRDAWTLIATHAPRLSAVEDTEHQQLSSKGSSNSHWTSDSPRKERRAAS
ncbi:hypothetical protein I79_007851 [Cricetulus griseus]|uniref:Secreted protein n=1 Tax=Cricetulus griseus TaxID=10029 RepID=G3HBL7_CRIGR|nr:hypothetical protein I79_007851 [Cricetulus griseus]